jgi:antitoxin YefM
VGQLLHLRRTQPGRVGTTGERHGVEALAGAAHVDADHGGTNPCGHAFDPARLMYRLLDNTMQVVSFSEARESFRAVLDRVEADADVTLITRRHAKGAVVMSLDTYNSLMETVHLLRSPANAAHLQRSLEQAGRGELLSHGLIDPDPADAVD